MRLCQVKEKSPMQPRRISARNFRKYGWVIEYPGKSSQPRHKNMFTVILRERLPVGWRIAYLLLRGKRLLRLEQHPDSFESFEPVKGRTLLYVSEKRDRKKIACFALERPVILRKGIWHEVVTLGRESEIKICENASVQCLYWML